MITFPDSEGGEEHNATICESAVIDNCTGPLISTKGIRNAGLVPCAVTEEDVGTHTQKRSKSLRKRQVLIALLVRGETKKDLFDRNSMDIDEGGGDQ